MQTQNFIDLVNHENNVVLFVVNLCPNSTRNEVSLVIAHNQSGFKHLIIFSYTQIQHWDLSISLQSEKFWLDKVLAWQSFVWIVLYIVSMFLNWFVTKLSTCDFYHKMSLINSISDLVACVFEFVFAVTLYTHNSRWATGVKCFVTAWLSCMPIHTITIS